MKAICNNIVIAKDVKVANSFVSRFIGLMNKKSINGDEGLLLVKCSSVHCFFMKFTIDAVYLSKDMVVLHKETIRPWKIGKIVKKCAHVLELKEGAAKEVLVGEYIVFSE